jgi:hypothetical protein
MRRRWTIGIILALGMLTALGAFAVSAAALPGRDLRQIGGPGQEEREQRRSQFMERVAEKLGVSPDRLRQAFAETREELGIGERLREHRRGRDGEAGPRGFGPRGGEFGARGFGRRDGEGPRAFGPGAFGGPGAVRGIMGRQMEIVATAIGIAPEQLREELRGSTIESVAQAHGVNPQAVASALQNNARERLNEGVANGRLSQERADEMAERIGQAIQRMMTMEVPDRPALRERFRGEPRS